MSGKRYQDRELSWLSFNHRVLQEAGNPEVPLFERFKFLAIFSSNLDEFFKVRVASLRSIRELKKAERGNLDLKPRKLLKKIRKEVQRQQEEFGRIYRDELLPELAGLGIQVLNDTEIPDGIKPQVMDFYNKEIRGSIDLTITTDRAPFIKNRCLYLIVRSSTGSESNIRFVELPSEVGRFQVFQKDDGSSVIMFLDDIVRLGLKDQLNEEIQGCYSISISRDAELYLEDEFTDDMLESIKLSLSKRKTGLPTRMLYDAQMPEPLLRKVLVLLQLREEDLSEGYRYHHYHDFFGFPNPDGKIPTYPDAEEVVHQAFDSDESMFDIVRSQDRLLHFPYHSYDPVIRFLNEAAEDADVQEINMTLYRVASGSKVVASLLKALENGKKVTAFVEVKARFDEQSNIDQIQLLKDAGAEIHYDLPALKVHCKICWVVRNENDEAKGYAFLSTGNFNEKTSRIYTDLGLFTADENITADLAKVFERLRGKEIEYNFNSLFVAPDHMPENLCRLIDNEINEARGDRPAWIKFKMNSLQDTELIDKIHEAAEAGVQVDLIIRGICCLVPDSPNIYVRSIVGQYLEHSRVYMLCNSGQPLTYVGSADLMKRNLRHRLEVLFPILDQQNKAEIERLIDLQLTDNVKARVIDPEMSNSMIIDDSATTVNSQEDFRTYLNKN